MKKKERGFMPLFFLFIFVGMNPLLLLRDNNQGLYYIPVKSIQDVRRTDATTIIIYTNIISHDSNSNPHVLTYTLDEPSSGGGVTDSTQVQAIINAWISALKGTTVVVEAGLPLPISSVTATNSIWG